MRFTDAQIEDLIARLDAMPRVDVAFTVNTGEDVMPYKPVSDNAAHAMLIKDLRAALQGWVDTL